MGGAWADPGYSLFWHSSNIRVELQRSLNVLYDVSAPSYSAWHYLAFTWDINSKVIQTYIDGVVVGSGGYFDGPIGNPTQILSIGKNANHSGYVFNGIIDEARVQSISRPAGWILTEYNNQSTPGTFYTIGNENPCSVFTFNGICSGTPFIYSVPNTPGHTYSWNVVGGTPSSTTGNSITVTWNASGPYSIQLTETSGSCSTSSINYSVVVNPLPVGV